jgi:uncharacterized repeat protein (TIGR03803 family)
MNQHFFRKPKRLHPLTVGALLFLGVPALAQTTWQGEAIHAFSGTDGLHPLGDLISDNKGSLYGASEGGGKNGDGVVYKLSPPAPGRTSWSVSTLWSFGGGADGADPAGGLIFGPAGALLGTTSAGGAHNLGTVFILKPPKDNGLAWTHEILWSFGGGKDGASPQGVLTLDTQGALYGVTGAGGASNGGVAFRLSPTNGWGDKWNETLLWSFGGAGDGVYPQGNLIFDHRGALYGALREGGAYANGAVFQLAPPLDGNGPWRETLLHSFQPCGTQGVVDGTFPIGGLTFDTGGSLYGVTIKGGICTSPDTFGVIYRLSPPTGGQTAWTETLLHSFTYAEIGSHHGYGYGDQIFDTQGSLYGVIGGSEIDTSGGAVYKLTPPSGSQTGWSLVSLYTFVLGPNGGLTNGGLVFGPLGTLYLTTFDGGPNGVIPYDGAVFQITPPGAP